MTDHEKLVALVGSIQKWKLIAQGKGVDMGMTNCPLCSQFNTEFRDCAGCPVAIDVEESGCTGTPYADWWSHWNDTHNKADCRVRWPKAALCEECVTLAWRMVWFLCTLIPEDEV